MKPSEAVTCTITEENKLMPTNNQEKWEERFEEQFHYLRQIFHDGLSGKESEEEEIKSIKSFFRQEIRQAKIEERERITKIIEEMKTDRITKN